ncbi:neurturin-like [Megalops cyprinoides]|uniref:neurturin-like n=1 Tax=Megalops cyprinoides TaxID=118141 RepID=UPI0018646EB8|nr:neurturin-like [Megalops cyprinoides]
MKLWKCAALALMLCGAALSLFLIRNMVPARAQQLHSWASSSTQPLPSPSTSSSSLMDRHHRRARAAEGMNSLLSELSHVFQSFTEGELKQIIGTFVDKKVRRDSLQVSQSKRTKRARKGLKPCSLRYKEVTVSELGLGFESDEVLQFQYCSGKCTEHRRNYDITLENMKKKGIIEREKRSKARHKPCCRPITYEDISFLSVLGNSSSYHTIHKVLAQKCGCV